MIIKLRPEDIRRYNWYIWKTLIAFVALFILLLVVTYFGLFGPLPTFRAIENPKSFQASEVLAQDKTVLGTYYVQNRSSVNYSQLSPNVVNALIATEDIRFKEHSGIDFQRLPGIVFFTLIGKKTRRQYNHPAIGQEPVLRPHSAEPVRTFHSKIKGMDHRYPPGTTLY